jgi:hypothetical protein
MDDGLLGWVTCPLVKLDDEQPGIIARVLTASPGRRQAIFAALSAQESGEVVGNASCLLPRSLAEVVRHGRASDILRHAFPEVPQGFTGMLERIGDRPLPRARDYLALRDMLLRGDTRSVDALSNSGRISVRKLEVLSAIDPRWRHKNTLTRIDTPGEATRFNAALEFVQSVCSRADDGVVAAAIAAMGPSSTLPRLLDRFVRRADRLPEHPVQVGDDELRPFTTMRDYLDAARRYRNCLASKLDHVAAGRLAIAEFRGEVLLEFRPLTAGAGWMLWLVHGHRNSPVACSVCEAAEQRCGLLGIPRVNEAAGGSRWRSFRSFAREMDWD